MHVRTSGEPAAPKDAWRSRAERVVGLAEHLSPGDRALIQGIFDRGMSARQLAQAVDQQPRTIRHRVRRLVEYVGSPSFSFVLTRHAHWPRRRREIAEAVFLQGASQRDAARKLGLTVHQVRQEIQHIRALIEHAAAPEHDPGRGL